MPESLNAAIELHDSVVQSIFRNQLYLLVALRPAWIHKTTGTPGVDAGSCFVQDVILEFGTAETAGEIGDLPADMLDGELRIEDMVFSNMITLPCEFVGATSFSIHLSPDYRAISITGHGIKAKLEGEPRYIQEFRS